MAWRVEFAEPARDELARLDRTVAKRIVRFLRERLAPSDDPRAYGQALKGPALAGLWKYRVGDHRVIAAIEDGAVRILVVRIGHRRDIYRRP